MHSIRHSRDVRVACILLMLLLTGQSVRRIVIDRASGLSNLTSVNTSQATDFSLAAQSLTTTKATEWDLSNQIVDKPEEQQFAIWNGSQIQVPHTGSLLHEQATSSLRSKTPQVPDFSGEWKLTKIDTKKAWELFTALGVNYGKRMTMHAASYGQGSNLCKIEHNLAENKIMFRTWNFMSGCQPKKEEDFCWLHIGAGKQKTTDPQGNPQMVTPVWEDETLVQYADGPKGGQFITKRDMKGSTMIVTNEYQGIQCVAEWRQAPGEYETKWKA